jgi:hypothetical protein
MNRPSATPVPNANIAGEDAVKQEEQDVSCRIYGRRMQ